ncbi:unnamed protein product [Parnassius mnemosyne]|uniref:Ankyrin repeat domain-containing protein 39 n=1 Tax=Parnassius mnemosyne TaxID=213953 RepID=A0AAV1M678_9NEOP
MDDNTKCNHASCSMKNVNKSVCQTLSEMDWERGLWNAAFSGDEEKVKMLINKARNAKEIVNCPDNAGYTPLHYAARSGHVNICNILLQNGADINAETRSGKATPLHKAAAAGIIIEYSYIYIILFYSKKLSFNTIYILFLNNLRLDIVILGCNCTIPDLSNLSHCSCTLNWNF